MSKRKKRLNKKKSPIRLGSVLALLLRERFDEKVKPSLKKYTRKTKHKNREQDESS